MLADTYLPVKRSHDVRAGAALPSCTIVPHNIMPHNLGPFVGAELAQSCPTLSCPINWGLLRVQNSLRKGLYTRAKMKGRTCLELGSGMGLSGIAAAMLGCTSVLTDVADVLPLLSHNATCNFESSAWSSAPFLSSLIFLSVFKYRFSFFNTWQHSTINNTRFYCVITLKAAF